MQHSIRAALIILSAEGRDKDSKTDKCVCVCVCFGDNANPSNLHLVIQLCILLGLLHPVGELSTVCSTEFIPREAFPK